MSGVAMSGATCRSARSAGLIVRRVKTANRVDTAPTISLPPSALIVRRLYGPNPRRFRPHDQLG